jgi:hypothetical protein
LHADAYIATVGVVFVYSKTHPDEEVLYMSALQQSLGQQLASELRRLRLGIAKLDGRTDPDAQHTREVATAEMRTRLEQAFGDESFVRRIHGAIGKLRLCHDEPIPTIQELTNTDALLQVHPSDIEHIVDIFAPESSEPYSNTTRWTLGRLVRITRQVKQAPRST